MARPGHKTLCTGLPNPASALRMPGLFLAVTTLGKDTIARNAVVAGSRHVRPSLFGLGLHSERSFAWFSSGGSRVRLGIGRVRSAKTTATRCSPAKSSASAGTGKRMQQGISYGTRLIRQPGELRRQDHGGIVRHLDRPSFDAVRQGDQHGRLAAEAAVTPRRLLGGGEDRRGNVLDLGAQAPVEIDRRRVGRDHGFHRIELLQCQPHAEGAAGEEGGAGRGRLT